MMKRTHISIGLVATIPLILLWPTSVIGVLGSTAPDWDFYLGIKHRTITHSLLFLALSTAFIGILNIQIALVWFINYGLHLLADSFTKMGTPYLYPFKNSYYGYRLIHTAGSEDCFIQLSAIFFICYFYL